MKTVLIAEDESLVLKGLSHVLSAHTSEYRVLTAEDGQETINILKSQHIDLLITDISMPILSGLHVLAYLLQTNKAMPVIVMSAHNVSRLSEQIKGLNAITYLQKPFNFLSIPRLIREKFEQTSAQISSITLFSFLQIVQLERKTCSLCITSSERKGWLYFRWGEIIHAVYASLKGQHAACQILSWSDPEIEIHHSLPEVTETIQLSLNQLISLTVRLQHERNGTSAYPSGTTQTFSNGQLMDQAEPQKESPMSNIKQTLDAAMDIDGAIGVALVDWNSGMTLGTGGAGLNLEVAAAGNTNVVRAKLKVMKELGLRDRIEDVLISLGSQYHLIRLLESNPNLFLYLALNRTQANLGLARHRLSQLERELAV